MKGGDGMPRKRPKTIRTETNRIIGLLKAAGTYQPYYVDTIDHLARLYLELEEAEEEFDISHRRVTIVQTNIGGSRYVCMNPVLQTKYKILEQCRYYESKLGLTPADHHKLVGGDANAEKQESSLSTALRLLSG